MIVPTLLLFWIWLYLAVGFFMVAHKMHVGVIKSLIMAIVWPALLFMMPLIMLVSDALESAEERRRG